MKKILFALVGLLVSAMSWANADVPFSIQGIKSGDKVTVTLSSNSCLETIVVAADGEYSFSAIPTGVHYMKVEAIGYQVQDAMMVNVNEDGTIEPFMGIQLVVTPVAGENMWTHTWHEDGSVSGYTTTSYVNTPPEIEVLGKKIVPSDVPSQALLLAHYGIALSEEKEKWTQEYAYRLVETMKTIPNNMVDRQRVIMMLTDESLTDDMLVEEVAGGKIVTISKDAFAYANPFLVTLDGVRGRFFSKRLHHAMVKLVTDFGSNRLEVDRILTERFGCSVQVADINALTGEDAGNFQDFYPSELTAIINMLEELPEGFHKTAQLKYLLRRQDGHVNPNYKSAAAISWCGENGYIEFINAPHLDISAFGGNNEQFDTQRLILHEKTHFLWAFAFSEDIKNDWIELGGWYRDPNAGDSGWSTTKTTEFVSAYAHGNNPNEDMAESVAYYLKDSEALRSRSLPKYEFIRDRIMHGTRYVSHIPDHLTFEVLNLWPDYDYPGKIKSVSIVVTGAPEEDKQITFDLELSHVEGLDDGANWAYTRIVSPTFIDEDGEKQGTYIDLGFSPVDGNPWHLRGTATISKYSKAGYWAPEGISVNDAVGNSRYEGNNDCVTSIYINNVLEDLKVPVYEKGSLRYELMDAEIEGHHEQILSVKFKSYDNVGIRDVYGGLYAGSEEHMPGWNTVVNPEEKTIELQYRIRDYFATADYYIAHLGITDIGGLSRDVRFSDDPKHEPVQKIHITTPNPDYEHAELDLNRIYVHAEPTHPEAPDGETKVEVTFYARDNIAGLDGYSVSLRDPQGLFHTYGTTEGIPSDAAGYFDGDPTAWRKYTMSIILPQGSAPGIWGIGAIDLSDHAFNNFTYNFVETLIFEPDDSETDYVLFANLDNDMLSLRLMSESTDGYGYTYRIISDESGLEITGTMTREQRMKTRASDTFDKSVDISSLPDGKIIVIVNVVDADGKIVAVRSQTLEKSSGSTGIDTTVVKEHGGVRTVDYYDAAGRKLDVPVQGVNIMKINYVDGTTQSVKVTRR